MRRPGGCTYRGRKITPCSEIKGPEKAAKSFYEMILKTGVRGQGPAEIKKRIEHEIKEVTTMPGKEGYKLLGLYKWGCENGYTINNLCRGSCIGKKEGGYIITASAAGYTTKMGFTASIMLHKSDWLGGSDIDLWVSVVEKDNPWFDPPSMEVVRKNFKQMPKTIKKVSLNYKKPIPAHQKNKTNITIRVTDQHGLPISGRESTDAMLNGLHTTIGLLNTCQSFADLVKGTPVDPYSEALKILYENAKTFYQIHRKFKDAAESWEDILFMPIIVEVKDSEGHSTRRTTKYGVKFSRKANQ